MIQLIGNKWDEVLAEEYQKEYFKKIILYINKDQYSHLKIIY